MNTYTEWSKKAANNAFQLAEESRILFDANRMARAYYLAHMSTEESSKSILLHFMGISGTPESDIKNVKKLISNHKKKIEFIVTYAAYLSPALSSELKGLEQDLISHINDLKNDTMYVSHSNGSILTPDDKVSGVPVSVHVKVAEAFANFAKSLLTSRSS